ncbi:hypothetical protein LEP1GSC122_4031 [Leptospira kirschneri serovar Valbuzzi str. 200702274]|nr:hypothetical protein LEP1GSC122_4031 [Leptospira kirschneri serovar Valbuzzi str. 200702274]
MDLLILKLDKLRLLSPCLRKVGTTIFRKTYSFRFDLLKN